ncbi:helix-turn-helix domain-containing protein [Propionibacteriaceae bacterium Y2011]|uniref:helix-turn-helix domain-containing protein n=1 Tax=Microlunatus sp. Y2014 TaxID=3418488 RepID=UPI003B4BFDBF
MDVETLVVDAFAQLGVDARPRVDAAGIQPDLVLDPDGVAVGIEVKGRTLITDDVASRLLAGASGGAALLLVGDRVTESARRLLTRHHGGYLDLRGRVGLRTDRLIIDAPVEPVTQRSPRSEALGGKAGLEVATALLMEQKRGFAVRELARQLGRSPSTVSEVLAALRREGLIDETNAVVGPGLFWRVAERWPNRRTLLASAPLPGESTLNSPLRFQLDDPAKPGWALTDSAAAAAYGAPLAIHGGQALDFFVPDRVVMRRAATLFGTATSSAHAQATARVAPVPAAARHRFDVDQRTTGWLLTHPLFVALDLAQDVGRGREILDAWEPDERWTRVW